MRPVYLKFSNPVGKIISEKAWNIVTQKMVATMAQEKCSRNSALFFTRSHENRDIRLPAIVNLVFSQSVSEHCQLAYLARARSPLFGQGKKSEMKKSSSGFYCGSIKIFDDGIAKKRDQVKKLQS